MPFQNNKKFGGGSICGRRHILNIYKVVWWWFHQDGDGWLRLVTIFTAHLNHHCGMVRNWPKTSLYLCGTRLGDSQCQSIMLKICTEFNYIMIQLNLKFCQIWQCSSRVMKFLVMYKNLVNYLWWKSDHPNSTSKRWTETKPVHQVLPNVSMEDSVTSNQARKMFQKLSRWDGRDMTQIQLALYRPRYQDSQCQLTPLEIYT